MNSSKFTALLLVISLVCLSGPDGNAPRTGLALQPETPPGSPALTVRLNLGPVDPTIDPARAEGWGPGAFVANQLFLGLVRVDDETGAPIPDLAISWTMSPEATVFTFTLRSGATWTDDNPVTAYDIQYGILRSLDPATAAPAAYLLYVIENAEAFNQGVITNTDLVGVTVLDYTHLRFTLKEPAAYLPNVLALPLARTMPAWAIAAHPDDWTEPASNAPMGQGATVSALPTGGLSGAYFYQSPSSE